MATPETSLARQEREQWSRFRLMLLAFLICWLIGSSLPTPGQYSHLPSRWVDSAAVIVVCMGFLVTVVRLFRRGRRLGGAQTTILCILFGWVLIGAGADLSEADVLQRFL